MNIERREDRLQWTEAEKAIQEAVDAVERAGVHACLTEAVVELGYARAHVANYVDNVRLFNVSSDGYSAMIGATSSEEARSVFRRDVDPISTDSDVKVEEIAPTAEVTIAESDDKPDPETKCTPDRWIALRGRGVIGISEQ